MAFKLTVMPGHDVEMFEPKSIPPVMPALVAGIHALKPCIKDVDGRDKPGHDVQRSQADNR
jgi:hypothetical protein